MSQNVAILGATGLVGRTALRVLEERRFPVGELRLLAGESAGRSLPWCGRQVAIRAIDADAFAGIDIALFTCANDVSRTWAPRARAAGVRVVDNSSAFRYDDAVPLVVPEINGALLEERPTLVANPNCSTIAIALALAPLERAVGLQRVVVSTYQSVSGAGSEALAELEAGIRAGLDPGVVPARGDGPAPVAYNVVPRIDRFETNGYTREEMKIVWETRKILGRPDLPVSATAVRVPVRVGHAAAVTVALRERLDPEAARALWAAWPGLEVLDDPLRDAYPMPLDYAGRDAVGVGRVRVDLADPRGLVFWVVADNLRKGAATNAVQIAERLVTAAAPRSGAGSA